MALGAPARIGAWRRTCCVGALVGAALLTTTAESGTSAAAPAQTPFNNGLGTAKASGTRLDPVAGGLSFGVGVGEALAGHQNTVATAESRAANTGVIGTSLAAQGCDGGDPTLPADQQPGILRASSNDEGAEDGFQDQDPLVPGVDRAVRATDEPYAEATTTSAGMHIPGVIDVGATISRTHSGVFGDYREAVATVDIDSVDFAGALQISGLHWEAVHRTGSQEVQSGSFTFGSITAGSALPLPLDVSSLDDLNDVLRLVGFEIRSPTFHLDQTGSGTISTVDPLTIAIVPAQARDSVLGPLISTVQPARASLFQALIDADCSTASAITVLDVVQNATGAGGEFGIKLGGVQATTSALSLFSGLGSLPPLPPLGPAATGSNGATSSGSGSSGGSTIGGGSTGGLASAPTGSSSGTGAATPVDDAEPAAFVGERGGAMAAVGGAGLLALLAAAEGDRRKMRRAQREIPVGA